MSIATAEIPSYLGQLICQMRKTVVLLWMSPFMCHLTNEHDVYIRYQNVQLLPLNPTKTIGYHGLI